MKRKRLSVLSCLLQAGLFVCSSFTFASAQPSGGPFRLDKTVMANGGGTLSGGSFSSETTIGQPLAGTVLTGGNFVLQSGFWTSTASFYSVSGRVMTATGRGITNAAVTLDDNGTIRTAITGRNGIYSFGGVVGGRTYVLRVASQRFSFLNNPRAITVADTIANENFVTSQ